MLRLIQCVPVLAVGIVFAAMAQTQTAQAQSTRAQTTDTSELSLYIVEQCASLSQGGRCRLEFVQVPTGLTPTAKVSQTCAPGWLVHLTAERGTVEKGGINRGQAVVCGHTDPESAIRSAMIACDEQTFGICQDADYVNVQWGFWSGDDAALMKLVMDEPLPIEQLPKAQQCASAVPLVESASCPPTAAVLLRQSGLR
ncbi:MAG TPA: hypothetical protein VIC30_08615 [Orrella sp.]